MGKKKHKKKQKKARLDEQPGTSSGSSSLHRIGQALLDQARSPAGRQLLATGLIVAASALARETTRRPSDGAAPSPEPASPETPPPQQEGGTAKPQQESGTTKSGISEVVTLAGMALSALDQLIHRPPSDNKG